MQTEIEYLQRLPEHDECNKTLTEKICGLEHNLTEIKKSRDDVEYEMKSEKDKYHKLIEQIETEKKQYQNWLRKIR